MVAEEMSKTELSDLIKVELPWSVPTAGESRIYLFIYSQNYLKTCLRLKVLVWGIEQQLSQL